MDELADEVGVLGGVGEGVVQRGADVLVEQRLDEGVHVGEVDEEGARRDPGLGGDLSRGGGGESAGGDDATGGGEQAGARLLLALLSGEVLHVGEHTQ